MMVDVDVVELRIETEQVHGTGKVPRFLVSTGSQAGYSAHDGKKVRASSSIWSLSSRIRACRDSRRGQTARRRLMRSCFAWWMVAATSVLRFAARARWASVLRPKACDLQRCDCAADGAVVVCPARPGPNGRMQVEPVERLRGPARAVARKGAPMDGLELGMGSAGIRLVVAWCCAASVVVMLVGCGSSGPEILQEGLLHVVSTNDNQIRAYHIEPEVGILAALGGATTMAWYATSPSIGGVAGTGDGTIFVGETAEFEIQALTVDQVTGAATTVTSVRPVDVIPQRLVYSDGLLFVFGRARTSVTKVLAFSVFRWDAVAGTLTEAPGSPCSWPNYLIDSVSVEVDGHVYAVVDDGPGSTYRLVHAVFDRSSGSPTAMPGHDVDIGTVPSSYAVLAETCVAGRRLAMHATLLYTGEVIIGVPPPYGPPAGNTATAVYDLDYLSGAPSQIGSVLDLGPGGLNGTILSTYDRFYLAINASSVCTLHCLAVVGTTVVEAAGFPAVQTGVTRLFLTYALDGWLHANVVDDVDQGSVVSLRTFESTGAVTPTSSVATPNPGTLRADKLYRQGKLLLIPSDTSDEMAVIRADYGTGQLSVVGDYTMPAGSRRGNVPVVTLTN